jgi:hypothetical protein
LGDDRRSLGAARMEAPCPKRKLLTQAVADAMAAVERLKADYESVKIRDADAGRMLDALAEHRSAGRSAQRALDQHVAQHGCKT